MRTSGFFANREDDSSMRITSSFSAFTLGCPYSTAATKLQMSLARRSSGKKGAMLETNNSSKALHTHKQKEDTYTNKTDSYLSAITWAPRSARSLDLKRPNSVVITPSISRVICSESGCALFCSALLDLQRILCRCKLETIQQNNCASSSQLEPILQSFERIQSEVSLLHRNQSLEIQIQPRQNVMIDVWVVKVFLEIFVDNRSKRIKSSCNKQRQQIP